jgi:cellulose synthase/poly-beta-1,6-N-acetylglucosamine synthase-like glycosyltransferase
MSVIIALAWWTIMLVYCAALLFLAVYGLHSLYLLSVYLCRRRSALHREYDEIHQPPNTPWPEIVVQIPIYNERDVVAGVITACAQLDYPRDKLTIQLLDDSDDDTSDTIRALLATLPAGSHVFNHVQRTHRDGFKAGALRAGMAQHPAPFIAIFDADFTPTPDFLRRAVIPLLADEKLAFVQARWEHRNRAHSALTAAQALGIDSHFVIEQSARAWHGLTLNFNGTCGVWRRAAIEDAGNWHSDTLTEDMDLSYRAQLRGWRATYRSTIAVAGEIPTTLGAWRSQQFRWAKGSLQTALKLSGPICRAPWSITRKIAALFHVTHYIIHPLIMLSVFCAPLAMLLLPTIPQVLLTLMIGCFIVGAGAPFILYLVSQLALHGWRGIGNLRYLPLLTAMGTGIALSNSIAAWQAWRGAPSIFVRTPKIGQGLGSYRPAQARGWPEILVALWSACGLMVSFSWSHVWLAPLVWLYTGGFAWLGWRTLREKMGNELPPTTRQLMLLGVLSLIGYGVLAYLANWREFPVTFALIGVVLGFMYLRCIPLSRTTPSSAIPVIIGLALIMRLIALGLTPSDDVARYTIEGQQIWQGENPYLIPPRASTVIADLPAHVTAPLNHGDWTAIYPPLALAYHALASAVSVEPAIFQWLSLLGEITCWFLLYHLCRAYRLDPLPALVITAWNPLGPLFITGEGHHDVWMVALLLAGLLAGSSVSGLSQINKILSVVLISCAALLKPFAALCLIPVLMRLRWWYWFIPPLLAAVCYVPFMSAEWQLFASLGRFSAHMHFHGALEPLLRECWSWFVPSVAVRTGTSVSLLFLLATALVIIVRQWYKSSSATSPHPYALARVFAALSAALLLCLPTLHPWYLYFLVAFLPFTPSFGLRLWTAMAPLYWLHGIALLEHGTWSEIAAVTLLTHLPALLVIAWELCGKPRWYLGRQLHTQAEVLPDSHDQR